MSRIGQNMSQQKTKTISEKAAAAKNRPIGHDVGGAFLRQRDEIVAGLLSGQLSGEIKVSGGVITIHAEDIDGNKVALTANVHGREVDQNSELSAPQTRSPVRRQEQVQQLADQGLTQQVIAERLGVSQRTVSTDLKRAKEQLVSAPVICLVNSAKPQLIEKSFATDPRQGAPVSGVTEMTSSTAFGDFYIAEAVLPSVEWAIYEDGIRVAQGKRRHVEPLVSLGSIRTHYIRTFLEKMNTAQ